MFHDPIKGIKVFLTSGHLLNPWQILRCLYYMHLIYYFFFSKSDDYSKQNNHVTIFKVKVNL